MVLSFGSAFTRVVARAKRCKQRCMDATSSAKTGPSKAHDAELVQSPKETAHYTPLSAQSGTFTRSSSEASTVYSPTYSTSTFTSPTSSPLPQNTRLQGWMYWARYDPVPGQQAKQHDGDDVYLESPKTQQTVMKVYAVLRNEFLLLYRDSHKSMRRNTGPLIQIAVERTGRSMDGAFHVIDPNGEEMELHLYNRGDEEVARRWETALELAAELTHSYFSTFEVKVENLPRSSMYRGTLHDFRSQRASFRQTTHDKLKSIASSRSFRASMALGSRLRSSIYRSSSAPLSRP